MILFSAFVFYSYYVFFQFFIDTGCFLTSFSQWDLSQKQPNCVLSVYSLPIPILTLVQNRPCSPFYFSVFTKTLLREFLQDSLSRLTFRFVAQFEVTIFTVWRYSSRKDFYRISILCWFWQFPRMYTDIPPDRVFLLLVFFLDSDNSSDVYLKGYPCLDWRPVPSTGPSQQSKSDFSAISTFWWIRQSWWSSLC